MGQIPHPGFIPTPIPGYPGMPQAPGYPTMPTMPMYPMQMAQMATNLQQMASTAAGEYHTVMVILRLVTKPLLC